LSNRFLKESGANKATMNTLGMAVAFERERLNENNAPTDDRETGGRFHQPFLSSFYSNRCQFHQRFMHKFFVRKSFRQLFSSYMYVEKAAKTMFIQKMLLKLTPTVSTTSKECFTCKIKFTLQLWHSSGSVLWILI